MPRKSIEFTEIVTIRLTPDMYQLVTELRRLYGSDADVVRAGIMALWRESELWKRDNARFAELVAGEQDADDQPAPAAPPAE